MAEIAAAAGAAVLALALAVVALRIWRGSLEVPFEYASSDANYQLMLVKGVLEHGWWFTNSSLGAPFEQELYDFAVGGDNLHFVLIKLLGVFSSSPAVVANLFYLLSFALSGLSAFVVLRWARIGRPTAVVCSVLYALTPYHFLRGEHHAFLAADYAVPLGAYLAVSVAAGIPLLVRRRGAERRLLGWLTPRSMLTIVACVAVASTGNVYYAAFVILLLGVAGLLGFAVRRTGATLVAAVVVMGAIVAVLAFNLAPTLLYDAAHGHNQGVALRQPGETDAHGLKLAQLLLPVSGHRIPALRELKRQYVATGTTPAQFESFDSSLGLVGSVGFLWLLWIALSRCVRRSDRLREPLLGEAAALTLVALLFAATGGLAIFVSYLVTPQLRAWNRLSIFIAFFALLAVAALLERLRDRVERLRFGTVGFSAVLTIVLVVGFLDQATPNATPNYPEVTRLYRNDARFVAAIERRLPPGAMVAQLPYVGFPETPPPGGMRDYDLLAGYLHSRRLRWSHGAMKGRPADWQAQLSRQPEVALPALAAAGFDGLYFDSAGYRGPRRAWIGALRRTLGAPSLVNATRRLLFFDLRAYRAELERRYGPVELATLREVTLKPSRLRAIAGAWPGEERGPDGRSWFWITARRGVVALVNPSPRRRLVVFSATLATAKGRREYVELRFPNGRRLVLRQADRGMKFSERLWLRPGDNKLQVTTDAQRTVAPQDRRTLYVQIRNPSFFYASFARLVSRYPRPGPGPANRR